MRIAVALIFAIALHAQAPDSSESVRVFGGTGSDLLRRCSAVGALKAGDNVSPQQLIEHSRHVGSCEGYIAGVNDMMMSHLADTPKSTLKYCLPSGVEMDQLQRVVKKWLEDNPSQLHLPAGVTVIRALIQAFPCG